MLKNSTNNGVSEIERIRWERERIILCLRNGIRYLAYITGYKRLDPGQSFTYRNGIRYLALVWLDGSTDLNCLKINTKLSFTRTTITSKSPSEAVFINNMSFQRAPPPIMEVHRLILPETDFYDRRIWRTQ